MLTGKVVPGNSTTLLKARMGSVSGRESALTSNDWSPEGSIGIILISALVCEKLSLNMSFMSMICFYCRLAPAY